MGCLLIFVGLVLLAQPIELNWVGLVIIGAGFLWPDEDRHHRHSLRDIDDRY